MKKVIKITESDLKMIVERVINEQGEERNYVKAIQRFLNYKYPTFKLMVDGKTGPNSQTANAIEKYQGQVGVMTDGVWGPETIQKMPPADLKMLKKFVAQEGDLFDKFLHWVGLD